MSASRQSFLRVAGLAFRIVILAVALLLVARTTLAADHAFVVNKDSRQITVVNMDTEQVFAHLHTGRNPRAAVTSPAPPRP